MSAYLPEPGKPRYAAPAAIEPRASSGLLVAVAAIALAVGGAVGFLIGRSTRTESRPPGDQRSERGPIRDHRPLKPIDPPPPPPAPVAVLKPDAGVPTRPARPDPKDVFSVPIGASPVSGPADARVTIVEFAEFACPFCNRVDTTLEKLRDHYQGKVRFVWKHFVVHPTTATSAARATCAAHQQGDFFRMQRKLWSEIFPAGGGMQRPALEPAALRKVAKALGLDTQQFDLDLVGCAQVVEADMALARQLGVSGTPAFFVNGRFLSGAQPFDSFRALIDEELAKAEQAIAAGRPAVELYDHIVATGKTAP